MEPCCFRSIANARAAFDEMSRGPGSISTLVWVTCALASLSGLAGLGHQIIWTRRLVDLLGASSFTFSQVLGAFFIGLATGSALAALFSKPVRHRWRWVAGAEISIALLSIPVLLTPQFADALYRSQSSALWKHLGPFLFVMPPAAAMGLVIPWMMRAVEMFSPTAGRQAVLLYAANTLGGVAGVASVMLWALPAWGLTGAGLAFCGLNLLLAAAALLISRMPSETAATLEHVRPAPIYLRDMRSKFRMDPAVAFLAFASGFLVLSLEVVVQHQFAQVTINSLFSNATVLAWGLLSLGAAAAIVPIIQRRTKDPRRRFQYVMIGAALACALQPFVFTWLRGGVDILAYELQPAAYLREIGMLAMLSLCPTFLVAGLLFPLLLAHVGAGRGSVALLLACNGFGGWCGAEAAHWLIAPSFGLWQSVVVIGAGYALISLMRPVGRTLESIARPQVQGAFASDGVHAQFRRWPVLGAIMVTAFLVAGQLPQVSVNPTERLAEVSVGREGVVATVECGPGDWRMIFNNSYTLGGSKARVNQERQSLLPLLLHGKARSVGLLGVATGGTLSGAALSGVVERIDAAELSPLVIEQARTHFAGYSRGVFDDSRVRVISEDARWMAATHQGAYDVVIGDLFLPWRTGEGRLFSLEQFRAVRDSLKPGGLYCQWLPMFQLTRPQFEAIARTFQQVFPDAWLVRGDFYAELPIVGLMGGRLISEVDWAAVSEGCEELRKTGLVADPLMRHEEGVAMMMIGPLPSLSPGPVNTLANAWLEWNAGKVIIGLQEPWFVGVPHGEFIRAVHQAGAAYVPEPLRGAHDAGQFFLTLEIALKVRAPVLPALIDQAVVRLPESLRSDADADWQQWPMRVKPEVFQSRRFSSTELGGVM